MPPIASSNIKAVHSPPFRWARPRYPQAWLILLPVSILLVRIQSEMTQHHPYGSWLFSHYMADDNAILYSRCLMRHLITAVTFWTPADPPPGSVNKVLQILFLWAALYRMAAFASRFASAGWSLAASLLAASFVPWGFTSLGSNLAYPYDLPTLFFSVAALEAIVSRRFGLLVLIVGIGTLNKETMVWIIPAYAGYELLERRQSRHEILTRLMLLVLSFSAVYWLARYQSGAIKTMSFQSYDPLRGWVWRYSDNIRELALLNQRDGLLLNVYWPLVIHAPALVWWKHVPKALKAFYLAALFHVIPTFLLGNIWEVRLFNELIPLGALASVVVMHRHAVAAGAARGGGFALDRDEGYRVIPPTENCPMSDTEVYADTFPGKTDAVCSQGSERKAPC
jgi:hypothetical protein